MFKRKIILFPVNFKLFDGEDGAGGEGEGAAGDGTGAGAGSQQATNTGDGAGQQTAQQLAAGADSLTPEQRSAKFLELVNGEYKDIAQTHFQSIFDKRFAKAKEREGRLTKLEPIAELLFAQYETDDIDQLTPKVKADVMEFLATKAGMDVATFQEVFDTKRENKQFKAEKQMTQQEIEHQTIIKAWEADEKSVKAVYPAFDLKAEALSNPQFTQLLGAGIPMQTAYEIAHMEEIMSQKAKDIEANVIADIKAKGGRPNENGTKPSAGFTAKTDISKMSDEEFNKLLKQVASEGRVEIKK